MLYVWCADLFFFRFWYCSMRIVCVFYNFGAFNLDFAVYSLKLVLEQSRMACMPLLFFFCCCFFIFETIRNLSIIFICKLLYFPLHLHENTYVVDDITRLNGSALGDDDLIEFENCFFSVCTFSSRRRKLTRFAVR